MHIPSVCIKSVNINGEISNILVPVASPLPLSLHAPRHPTLCKKCNWQTPLKKVRSSHKTAQSGRGFRFLDLTQQVSTRPQRYSIPLTSANTLLEQHCYILPLSVRQYRRRAKFKETRSDTGMPVEIFTSTETSVNKNRLHSALKSTVTDIQIYNGKKW